MQRPFPTAPFYNAFPPDIPAPLKKGPFGTYKVGGRLNVAVTTCTNDA